PLLLFCHRHPPPNCYPFSLHDALPISRGRTTVVALQRGHVQRERGEILEQHVARADRGQGRERLEVSAAAVTYLDGVALQAVRRDRKSTRLNSSHGSISYAVFRLKKKT